MALVRERLLATEQAAGDEELGEHAPLPERASCGPRGARLRRTLESTRRRWWSWRKRARSVSWADSTIRDLVVRVTLT